MAGLVRLKYPGGKIESLFHRLLFFPRATHHWEFCVRLVELALELPVRSYHDGCQAAHPKVRHCNELRTVDVEPWIVTVLEENVLAGMVLIDAVDYVMDLLSRLTRRDEHDWFDPQTKRRFTEMIGNTWVEFQVPVGWAFLTTAAKVLDFLLRLCPIELPLVPAPPKAIRGGGFFILSTYSDPARPRKAQFAALVAVRGIGKREALMNLAEFGVVKKWSRQRARR